MKWVGGSEDVEAKRCLDGRPLVFGFPGVGQLASEAVACCSGAKRIASWSAPGTAPIVGSSDDHKLIAPCELYGDATSRVSVFVLRSPVASHRADELIESIVSLADRNRASRLVGIGDLPASERRHFDEPPFVFDSESNPSRIEFAPGSFACKFRDACEKKGLECGILLKYCYEGDNRPDAIELVRELNVRYPFADIRPDEFPLPNSWKFIATDRPPVSIY